MFPAASSSLGGTSGRVQCKSVPWLQASPGHTGVLFRGVLDIWNKQAVKIIPFFCADIVQSSFTWLKHRNLVSVNFLPLPKDHQPGPSGRHWRTNQTLHFWQI